MVDSSALVAVIRDEPDAERFFAALSDRSIPKRMSAANDLEAAIVIDGSRSPIASRRLDEAIADAAIVIEPVTREQAEIARAAYRDFGKGSGHPAGLNFGDCFAYALAKAAREPLLFKGEDFSRTDVAAA
ncbi:type II toxin-antitoxin system VapC family toxin [Roseiarcus fermentans]|uniref:type II toxin-antitoxin system VapC family toxin n=1 Tax=Roseiarcus fermentans TaxID=1473586 RepID=UPI000DE86AD4|nr:type II toxin-antitoxin system VapC family toxin [Roseiarcus fermentans]